MIIDNVFICVTFSSLIYSGNLAGFYSIGLKLLLMGSIITLSITALFSSLPTAIAPPQDEPFPIFVGMSAYIAATLSVQNHMDAVFPTVICSIAIATIITGIFLYLLGIFKGGYLVSFIPYPVLGGFFAGVACLLLISSLTMLTGLTIHFDMIPELFKLPSLLKWLPAVCFALIFFIFLEIKKSALSILAPAILGIVILFYATAYVFNLSIADLQNQGFLIKANFNTSISSTLKEISFHSVNWPLILSRSGDIIIIALFSSISILINASSLQISLNKDIDFNRELRVAGVSNLLTGMIGGVVGYISASSTTLSTYIHTKSPKTSRLIGLFCALFSFCFLCYGLFLVAYIPLFIPGGILVYIAFLFIKKWIIDIRYTICFLDYCIISIILFFVLQYNPIYGFFAGIICSLLLFIINYSKVHVIQHVFTGKQIHSRKQREPAIEKKLLEEGNQLLYIKLQNYLFFGNAVYLVHDLENRILMASTPLRYIIYDFSFFAGLDSSFILNLKRMKQIADNNNVILIFANPGSRIAYLVDKIQENAMSPIHIFSNYDKALEWYEDQFITENKLELKKSILFEHPLLDSTVDVHYFKKITLKKGDILFHEGDPTGPLYYIESGHVHAFLVTANKKKIRLRTIGPGNTVGEVAFYLGQSRNATVIAADDCILQEFSKKNILQLQKENPISAFKFHQFIIQVLAERVEFENSRKLLDLSAEATENHN